ncbi:hypothetical protein BS78_04G111400 [Paspalum vaginatum]|nr:hypothetical protein BS78_04G111400 [Paspalum vaginatum]
MYPANHYMDPYHSHYRNHTPYPYYPPPRWEVPPGPPRAMDSSYRPASWGPWPYNAGMHNPHPSDYHCCCYQTYPPDHYSFRPPFPQELPPPHLYYHGPFPHHSNACPSYFVPPHPYPADQTPYGYDKSKSHCCGCPNHVCHGAEKSNVKIEEERPDVKLENEHKNADRGSIIDHPNNQYPFMWLPSGNMEGEENGKHYELSPQLLNRCPPGTSTRRVDMKQQKHDNQKEKQFQWPIVWMPAGYDEPKQKAKETEGMQEIPKAPNISGEAPQSPKIKIIPLSWFENGHHDQKPAAKDGSGGHNDRSTVKNNSALTDHQDGITLEGSPKTTSALPKRVNDDKKPVRENYKTIPVVSEKEIDEKKASTCRNIPVMKGSDEKKTASEKKEAKKVEENGKASAAKHSKLPPVCLRVDPLPRKKSGNGSSRSPSPPTRKEGDMANKDVKEAQGQNVEPKQADTTRDITVLEVKDKSPDEMKRGKGFTNETMQAASVENSQEEVPTSKHDQKAQAGSSSIGAQEDAGAVQENAVAESLKGCDERTNEDATVVESESAKDDAQTHIVNLPGPDAAVRIQSAYRGYDVRRWQPLDKLRKIRDVHKQMQDVRRQLQCLEDSCKKLTQKEQVAIGETIMNLLLKLDTIQGLHPSVREARKSIARELICLQEKLDTLCKQPSGGSNHTDNDGERAENVIQTAAPGVRAEASDREDRAVGLGKAEEPSLVDSVDLCDPLSSAVRQEADASEQKNKKEEPCATKMEKAHEEVQSSMDMMSDAALHGHHTDNQEDQIEETNAVSGKQVTEEEKPAAMDELEELPSASSMEPSNDAESSGDSSGLKQCPVSIEQNLHARSNAGLSPAPTKDLNASAAVISVENGVTTEEDGPVDSLVHETTAVENLDLKHDVSSAEDQQNETSSPVAHLEEDSLVTLKDVEQCDPTPVNDLVVSNTEDQQEARDVSMQQRALDTMQDSAKEPDGTPEASTNDSELAAPADAEKHDQTALVEPTLVSNSASELALDESEDTMPCGVSSKDEPPHVDDKAEPPTVDGRTEGSANGEDFLCEQAREEPNIQGGHFSLAEEEDDTRGRTVFPELESCELPCAHGNGITVDGRPEMNEPLEGQTDALKENVSSDSITVDERPEVKGPLEGQTDALKENGSSDSSGADITETDECTETLKEDAPVGKEVASPAEDPDLRLSETDKCKETPKDGPAHAVGANPGEDETNTPKEDVAVLTENKASEEASSGDASPCALKDSDEKKLAEENQKLKELLQKLLASGNDQMGVITDLSEKVNALERRLARKKRPKVRVHRPSRHATAKVH